jgi:hypothetical protein
MEYSKGQIIELLMNQYGVNTIVNPVKDISRKLTRKSIALPELKVITKNIFDIKEIQDLPEYDYDYKLMYLLRIPDYLYNYNTYENIDDYVKERYFSNDLINYNQKLFNIYKNIISYYQKINVKYIQKHIIFHNLLDVLKKYNIGLFFHRYLSDNLQIIDNNIHNGLIITASDNEIKKYFNFKCDIIYIKQQTNYEKVYNILYKAKPEIKNSFTINDLKNKLRNKNTYNNIYINNSYINYDYLISSVHLIIKSPYFINLLLVSLSSLNNNGNIFIRIFDGNKIELPILKKIFSIIVSLFDNYNIIPYITNNIIIIKFYKFNIIKYNKNKDIINSIINKINKYENLEFNLNDMTELLLTNKFYYKLDTELVLENSNHIKPIKPKYVLTDIIIGQNYYNIIDKDKSDKFIKEYNDIIHNNIILQIQLYNEIIKNITNQNILNNIINKYFDIKIIFLINLMRLNNLIDIDIDLIKDFIQKIFKKYNNINSFFREELLKIKNS